MSIENTKAQICITSIEFPPDIGGVGNSVQRIARLLSTETNYEVHVVVFNSSKRHHDLQATSCAHCETFKHNGIQVHRIHPSNRYVHMSQRDYLFDVYYQLKLLHKKYTFDLFHAFFIKETGFVTSLLAIEKDKPVICSIRGNDLHKHVFSPADCYHIIWTLDNANWLTFVSSDLLKRAQALTSNIKEKSSVVWNSVDPIDFSQLPKPSKLTNLKGITIGAFGRFTGKKGLEFLIEACSLLQKEVEFTLLLVGDFIERERNYWQQIIQNSRVANNIIVTGFMNRNEAVAYLPHIDIFVIPSIHDGCPNSLLEAMQAARPIIGTNVDAMGDFLEDGVDALLVNPASSVELAVALSQLIAKPELRIRLGSAALDKMNKSFNLSIERKQWLRLYRHFLK